MAGHSAEVIVDDADGAAELFGNDGWTDALAECFRNQSFLSFAKMVAATTDRPCFSFLFYYAASSSAFAKRCLVVTNGLDLRPR